MDPNLAPQTPTITPPLVPVAQAEQVPSQVTSAVNITEIAPPPEKGGKKKFLIIGVIVLLVLLVGSVFALTQTQKPATMEVEASPTPVATMEETDETASWETYSSLKYGFDFSYPNDWYFSPFDEEDALFGTHTLHSYDTTEIEEYMDHGILDIASYGKPIVKVEISPSETTDSPEEYMVNYLKDSEGKQVESDLTIGGLETKEVDYSSVEVGVFDYLREYIVFPENKVIRISVMYKSPDETSYQDSDLKLMVERILSTIEFTD